MTVEVGVERLAAMVLFLTCLSHITAPAAWRALFERIAKSDAPGLATAAIHLPLGLLLVAFHNVSSGPAVIFTLIGWALLVKGTLHLLFPQVARRSLAIGTGEDAERRYRLAGVILAPLAFVLLWLAWA
jgi:uncharacterized protein YjeT (DUF2065 family)